MVPDDAAWQQRLNTIDPQLYALSRNHLSWQWVARTFSIKPYLFNADNVAKYAPAAWHCT